MARSNADLSITDIRSQIKDHSVILFSPRFRNRNALLTTFVSSPNAYLHTLSKHEANLAMFANGLITDLSSFFPDFGEQTRHTLGDDPGNLATALAADLKRLKTEMKTLILDEFDNLSMDNDVAAFFKHLVPKLPTGLTLVINSRILWHRLWSNFIHSGVAVVLAEQDASEVSTFDPTLVDKPTLEVYGFGTGHVYIDGLPIDTWEGVLPRNLFFYFMDHPMATRDEIFETFWPGMALKEATNVFHVTKRKINERLGYELTTYSSGFYKPSDEIQIYYDVRVFEQAVATGLQEGNESINALHHAIHLYHNEFLHTINMPWVRERREQLHLIYANALISLGRIYKSLDETDKTIGLYIRALREVPQREDIHRDLMTIYGDRGEHENLVAQFKLLKGILWRTLGITPSSITLAHYNSLTGADK